ncbi:MAG: glycosyltransferase family 2 protein [bacterium]|nr:glycosyltransferase family 2 protein [Elusimicrobiota bacterium]
MTKYLTVIIPTYNRAETMKKCLKAIEAQTYTASRFEVIIVDDGSTDKTEELAADFVRQGTVDARYYRQKNRGPAAARNLGIKNADGEILLFIGDDIIAAPDLLKRHVAWHLENISDNAALLGYVTWDRSLKITPFMHWLENGGPQFSFNELENGAEADPCRFYTCNISLKRRFLTKNGLFDEEFPYAAFEDVELGYRLKAAGLKLFFNRKAVAWHHHYTSLEDACKRMIKVGESKKILNRKIGLSAYEPKTLFIRRVMNIFKISLYYPLAVFFEKRMIAAGIFKYVMNYYYTLGVERSRGGCK